MLTKMNNEALPCMTRHCLQEVIHISVILKITSSTNIYNDELFEQVFSNTRDPGFGGVFFV